jgi:hypothetical protein
VLCDGEALRNKDSTIWCQLPWLRKILLTRSQLLQITTILKRCLPRNPGCWQKRQLHLKRYPEEGQLLLWSVEIRIRLCLQRWKNITTAANQSREKVVASEAVESGDMVFRNTYSSGWRVWQRSYSCKEPLEYECSDFSYVWLYWVLLLESDECWDGFHRRLTRKFWCRGNS